MPRLKKLSIVVVAILSTTACEHTIKTTFSEPALFNGTKYCDEIDRSAELILSPETQMILDDKDNTYPAHERIEAANINAASKVAHQSQDPQSCKTILTNGEALFEKRLREKQNDYAKRGNYAPSTDEAVAEVQYELTRYWREDQSARRASLSFGSGDTHDEKYWAKTQARSHAGKTDLQSMAYLKTALETYDWIDSTRFGQRVSNHAWIIAQHADSDPEFQQDALTRMTPYFESGEVSKSNYAYLWDRVAVNTDRKQLYGTQPTWECENGKMALKPLEKPETVNDRRAALGMDTVEEGLAEMSASVCGASE